MRAGVLHRVTRLGAAGTVGVLVVVFWVANAIDGELFAPFDPYATDLAAQLRAPSTLHWLGTDSLGRDVLSRILVGSREILVISVVAAALGTVVGSLIGMVMGYGASWVDDILSRIAEAVIALPSVILALMVLAAVGRGTVQLIAVIAFGHAWVVARTVRSAVFRIRDQDFVTAASARGESFGAVLVRELMPNIAPVVVVEFTVRVGYSVFTVASLSFLGFGVQPPSADWGLQISQEYGLVSAGYWWPTIFPTLAIVSLVVGVYLTMNRITNSLTAGRDGT